MERSSSALPADLPDLGVLADRGLGGIPAVWKCSRQGTLRRSHGESDRKGQDLDIFSRRDPQLELTATSASLKPTSAKQRRGLLERGFSLIELMITMVVLAVGLLAGLGMIIAAIASNGGPKTNTATATLAESTMERIVAVPLSPSGVSSPTSLSDCAGNNFTINTAAGGSPLVTTTWGVSADFQQPPVPGYSMLYVNCATGQGLTYDIRWTIEPGPTPSTELVTVSARAVGTNTGPAAPFVRPVTL